MDAIIRSPANPLIKELRRLHRPAGRRRAGAFLVEGRRAIDGFLRHGWRPRLCLLREDCTRPPAWPEPQLVGEAAMARLSQQRTCAGFLACFPLPEPADCEAVAGGLLCWGLRDPGNLGTLLRSAAAFGHRQVVLVDCCDPWSAKVLQAGAGAMAGLRLGECSMEEGLELLAAGAPSAALVVDGGETPPAPDGQRRWLLVGGEAEGLSAAVVAACDERWRLPMAGAVESLNAAVAGSIVLYLHRR